jgi:hypothetical protein
VDEDEYMSGLGWVAAYVGGAGGVVSRAEAECVSCQ